MKIVVGEAFGYLAASGCALAFDMGLLRILVEHFSWNSLIAACVSFSAGTCVAYAISVTLVFHERRLTRRRVEFAGFAALGAAGLAVNAGVMFLAMRYLGLYYLPAKCVAAGFTFLCNFISRRQLLFVGNRDRVHSK
jgi:putative flippase GtrA